MLLHSVFMYTLHSILNNCIQYCIYLHEHVHYLCTLYMNGEYKHIVVQIHLVL